MCIIDEKEGMHMKSVGVLGSKDTFSYLCYERFEKYILHPLHPIFYESMHDLFKHVYEVDYVILPFENTLEGYVQQHMDLILKHDLVGIAEIKIPIIFDYVHHETVKTLYVQYAAKNQCLSFIENLNDIQVVVTDSNHESLKRYQKDLCSGAIIPHHVSEGYEHVMHDVADEASNQTRFLILSHRQERIIPSIEMKMSFVITPYNDRPGLLYGILKEFAAENINLISIMSRPTKKQLGTYHFFLELMIEESQHKQIDIIIDHIKKDFEVKILGIYPVLND
jgi:prephenate dehydratase